MSSVPGAPSERRPKVLVVDGNEVCRAVVRESLEEGGFDVVELGSPVGMSSVVNHEKPDIVLMDLEMPASELEKLARGCGASGLVPKTVTDAALASAVRSHVSG